MRRLIAVALIVIGVALPACGQHSASRGGFSGHSGSAFHGGFSASAPSRFASSSRYAGSRSLSTVRGFRRDGTSSFSARQTYAGARRYRRPYLSPSRAGIPYVVAPWTGWTGAYFPGYPDDSDYGDSPVAPAEAPERYDEQPAPLDHYQPALDRSHLSTISSSEDAVTLVFRNGRPPEQVHNYLLTRTTLYVLDQHHRDIPTDLLDLAATATVNHSAGIDFQLPAASR